MNGTITKLDARRQLLAAIHIHWYLSEPLAVYTLATNAWEIANSLLERTERIRMLQRLSEEHGVPAKEFRDLINAPRNFMKHADRDPNGTAPDLDEDSCDAVLMIACVDYLVAAGRSPLFAGLFIAWYSALYPEKTGEFFREQADFLFPAISGLERKAQLAAAHAAARQWERSSVMVDAKNDLTDNWRWIPVRRFLGRTSR